MQWILQSVVVGSLIGFTSSCGWMLGAAAPLPATQQGTAAKGAGTDPSVPADPDSFPEIVARVNGSTIHKQVFLERASSIQSDMGLPEGNLPLEIYRTILNEMIDMELLYQASQVRNFRPEADEIERQYESLVARFPSEEAFLKQLSSQGITSEKFKELMHKDLSVQKLVAEELAPRVSVSEESKRQYYNEHSQGMKQPERLRLRHILVSAESGSLPGDREEARAKIEKIHKMVIEDGTEFAAVAREFSDDSGSKDQGGELLIERGQMVPTFEEAAFGLEVGAVSEIIETRSGYHIIKLCERIAPRIPAYDEVESMIQQFLEQQELQTVINSEIEKLRQEASVEIFI